MAVHHDKVLGITFNSYLANKSEKIIAFRIKTEISAVHKGHTDRWLGPAMIPTLVGGIYMHPIRQVIEALKKSDDFWVSGDYWKAKTVCPHYYKSSVPLKVDHIPEEENKKADQNNFPFPADNPNKHPIVPGSLLIPGFS